MAITAELIARSLPKARKNGNGWKACCPAHDDSEPSLDLTDGKGGSVLFRCRSGCSQDNVLTALKAKGFWPSGNKSYSNLHPSNGKAANGSDKRSGGRAKPKLVKSWNWCDENGVLRMQTRRYEYLSVPGQKPKKEYKQFRPDPDREGEWISNVTGVTPLPYNLRELVEAIRNNQTIFIVEGEPKVDVLVEMGFVATCNAGGAGKWRPEWTPFFNGADVIILPDNDEKGVEHAIKVAQSLKGSARSIRIVELPNLPPKGDIVDWTAADPGNDAKRLLDIVHSESRDGEEWAAEHADSEATKVKAECTEHVVARLFVDHHVETLRYVHGGERDEWFMWDGLRWGRDRTRRALDLLRSLAQLASEGRGKPDRKSAGRAGFCLGAEKLAQADQRIAICSDIFDQDSWLLGTPAGTVALRTGILRPPRPEEYITKLTAVGPAEPGTECPLWTAFLTEATGNNAELMTLLQRWFGYCLTGQTTEQCLVFIKGFGQNGKTTLINAISKLLGDYATTAAMQTFVARNIDSHPEELASLAGARLVVASETEEGRQWSEAKIKQLTGGDMFRARFMHRNSFVFAPTFKLTFIGNHTPTLNNLDDAIRRRFILVPFDVKPQNPDKGLEEKLKAEWPAILRWMIDGCLAWQSEGLSRPGVVKQATAEYFDGQDTFKAWLDEKCDIDRSNDHKFQSSTELFTNWSTYAKAAGEGPGTLKDFNERMARNGFQKQQIKALNTKGYRGIRIRPMQQSWEARHDD